MKSKLLVPLLFAIALTFGGLSYVVINKGKTEPVDQKAAYLKGGAFSLASADGTINSQDFLGKPSIVYFGFTHCPDICPVGLSEIGTALKSNPKFNAVPVFFITVDPERDTKELLSEYVQFFHPNIHGLTGSMDDILEVSKRYGTYFRKTDLPDSDIGYTVDHTGYFYILDRDGELVRVLDHDTDAQGIASALKKFI